MEQKKEKNPVWREMGSKLWKFQQDLGMTQDQLAAEFSTNRNDKWRRVFTQRTIQGYEAGENELSGELLYNIHKAGYSIDALFKESAQQLDKVDKAKKTLIGVHGRFTNKPRNPEHPENADASRVTPSRKGNARSHKKG